MILPLKEAAESTGFGTFGRFHLPDPIRPYSTNLWSASVHPLRDFVNPDSPDSSSMKGYQSCDPIQLYPMTPRLLEVFSPMKGAGSDGRGPSILEGYQSCDPAVLCPACRRLDGAFESKTLLGLDGRKSFFSKGPCLWDLLRLCPMSLSVAGLSSSENSLISENPRTSAL